MFLFCSSPRKMTFPNWFFNLNQTSHAVVSRKSRYSLHEFCTGFKNSSLEHIPGLSPTAVRKLSQLGSHKPDRVAVPHYGLVIISVFTLLAPLYFETCSLLSPMKNSLFKYIPLLGSSLPYPKMQAGNRPSDGTGLFLGKAPSSLWRWPGVYVEASSSVKGMVLSFF